MLKKENLRKNFLRVKQIADQNLGRAEKTEVLTENLSTIDKRVELVKHVSSNVMKRMTSCLQGQGSDIEKRLKKIPETSLSHTMIESATLLGDNLIGTMYQMCGELEGTLGREVLQHELEMEEHALNPLQNILEVDIPNIAKCKKQLHKLVLDMDSAKSRYQSMVRQTQTPGSNPATAAAKLDNVKDEYEDASMRVDQCRDTLATEMYNFLAKETDYAKILIEFVESQVRYHEKSLQTLRKIAPEMKNLLDNYPHKPVYCRSLEDHLSVHEREIALVLEDCICVLMESGLDEEGLFRVAGSSSKVKKLKAAFDAGIEDMEDFVRDPHVVAGALKLYLRELPEPLMTYALYNDWMLAAQKSGDERLQSLWKVLERLPKANYNNLRYLIKFLAKLAESSEINKMSCSNIAIVMGPNLIWSPGDGGPNVLTTGTQSAIVDTLIKNADWFFPGDVEFQQTPVPSPKFNVRLSTSPSCQKHIFTTMLLAPPSAPHSRENTPELCSSALPDHPVSLVDLTEQAAKKNHKVKENGAERLPPPPPSIVRHSSLRGPRKRSVGSLETSQVCQNSGARTRLDLKAERLNFMNSTPVLSKSASCENIKSPSLELNDCSRRAHNHGTISEDLKISQSPPFRLSSSTEKPQFAPLPGPPPMTVHSDIYDTVFALQALHSDGWTDYLSRVRNMWEGHMNKRVSFTNPGETPPPSSGAHRDIDFGTSGTSILSSNSPSQPRVSPVTPHRDAFSSFSSISPATLPRSPAENLSQSAGNILDSSTTPEANRSPKLARRVSKKPAPPPPVPERAATLPRTADASLQLPADSVAVDRSQSLPHVAGTDTSTLSVHRNQQATDSHPASTMPFSTVPPSPEKPALPEKPVPSSLERKSSSRPPRPAPPPPPPPRDRDNSVTEDTAF